jgi:hypothetical protein
VVRDVLSLLFDQLGLLFGEIGLVVIAVPVRRIGDVNEDREEGATDHGADDENADRAEDELSSTKAADVPEKATDLGNEASRLWLSP